MTMQIKQRDEIAEEYRWELETMYADDDKWEEDFGRAGILVEELANMEGRLGESAGTLLEGLRISERLSRTISMLYVYARMRRDEDNRRSVYQELFIRAESLMVEAGQAGAFMTPEILQIDESRLWSFLEASEELAVYRHFFAEMLRQKAHTLSKEQEQLLAMSTEMAMSVTNIFSMLNNADIKFPVIENGQGEKVEITKGRYAGLMENPQRSVRQDAFEGLYSSYEKVLNTLGASLSGSVRKDIFFSRARKYGSCLEKALDADNIDTAVYDSLIEAVHSRLEPMYRYMSLRRRLLGVDELHMYDLYVPLVPEYKMEVPYARSREMVREALAVLGGEYGSLLDRAFAERWIDVYENEGKTSGAYSWGCYDSNPFMLLNYNDRLNDVFTLAHELGHSMHSHYSDRCQPYVYSQYSIFLAEVASTVNESLLIDHLLKNSTERRQKMYLLNYYLEQFRGTVYRQTMFAEFEKIIHERAEQGEPLVPENLNALYLDLNRLYYGPEVVLDPPIRLEWSRIPHFYSGFYVYKYATGFSAACALKQQIVQNGRPAVERYMEFLKAGSSDYPLAILQRAGVDLTSPEPVLQALELFETLLSELEDLAG